LRLDVAEEPPTPRGLDQFGVVLAGDRVVELAVLGGLQKVGWSMRASYE